MPLSLSTEMLSRIQFGFTIGFHILFPTLNIGLSIFLCFIEARWLYTKNNAYLVLAKFWTKVFALTFGMGVVSGVVLSYELGTNFAGFTKAVGEVLGPLFAYEVLSAFFLEAGFLGIMLFGWNRVRPYTHFLATLLVTIGTVISAFWILSANSWMQTPSGFYTRGHQFVVNSWLAVIFNPSFLHRYLHMLIAAMLTACFFVAGVSSWYLLRDRFNDLAKRCLSIVLTAALVLAPLQLIIGDMMGLIIQHYQPLKTAAIEANWTTVRGAPLILLGYPDERTEKNYFAIKIPYGASLLNTHDPNGLLLGLKTVPPQDRPVVAITFFAFRIMVGIGLLFIAMAFLGLILHIRKSLYTNRFFLRLCTLLTPLGFVAAISGWLTAESGRQPWIVYGLLRTADAVSPVASGHVLISLGLFICAYGVVFSFYLYYLFKIIRGGPINLEESPPTFSYIPHLKKEALE